MNTYTIALATRLKRKVFRAKNIPPDVLRIADAYLARNGIKLLQHRFYDYGFVLNVECASAEQAINIATGIRMETSRPIRELYPELWKMPSLWNNQPLVLEGSMTKENNNKIEKYYDGLKSR